VSSVAHDTTSDSERTCVDAAGAAAGNAQAAAALADGQHGVVPHVNAGSHINRGAHHVPRIHASDIARAVDGVTALAADQINR
jgi:aminoglycoside/choline kinase family phosphotransferase